MPEPMSPEELAAIRDRSREIDSAREAYDSAEDVPRLLDEVDRLRADLEESTELLASAERDREQYRAEVADYRSAICFETTCTGCARTLDTMARIEADRDALAAKLDAVHRILTPIDPDWKPLSERYPEHFPPVSAEEQARRDGWGQGVALLTQRIEGALTAPEPPRAPAQPGRERPETPGTGSDTSKRQGVSQAAKNEEDSYAEGGTDAPSAS